MSISLTGAIDFISGAIVANLVAKDSLADTRSTMRDDTPIGGLMRLRSNLRHFESTPGILNTITKSQIVPFDPHETGAAELSDPEVIINRAALVTFSNHPLPWETNVESVLALDRLAARGKRLKRFMQIGMATSCGQLANRYVSESWSVPTLQRYAVPYTYSKDMAELKLRRAMPELPLVMVRPSIVVGRSTLGYEPSDNIFWMLRMAVMLETFSYRLPNRVNILPVDDCAENVMQLTTRPALTYGLYHISADDANSGRIGALYPRFKRCETPEEDVQALAGHIYQERIAEKALARKFLSLTSDGNVRLVVRCTHLHTKFTGTSYVFDSTWLVQETGFQPRSLLAYLDRCLEASDAIPILKRMRWDYKQPSDLHGPHGVS